LDLEMKTILIVFVLSLFAGYAIYKHMQPEYPVYDAATMEYRSYINSIAD